MKTSAYSARYHRNGTVTYWSVYRQQWVRSSRISDAELTGF